MSARHTEVTDAMTRAREFCESIAHETDYGILSRLTSMIEKQDTLEREAVELRAWKDSAQRVESEWDAQAVGKLLGVLLGVPLGESIRANIQPRITAMLAALEAQVEADRLSGIYQTYADAPAHASDPDYDSRCDEMHAAWMQAQDLAEKLRDSALSAARGDGKGEA